MSSLSDILGALRFGNKKKNGNYSIWFSNFIIKSVSICNHIITDSRDDNKICLQYDDMKNMYYFPRMYLSNEKSHDEIMRNVIEVCPIPVAMMNDLLFYVNVIDSSIVIVVKDSIEIPDFASYRTLHYDDHVLDVYIDHGNMFNREYVKYHEDVLNVIVRLQNI